MPSGIIMRNSHFGSPLMIPIMRSHVVFSHFHKQIRTQCRTEKRSFWSFGVNKKWNFSGISKQSISNEILLQKSKISGWNHPKNLRIRQFPFWHDVEIKANVQRIFDYSRHHDDVEKICCVGGFWTSTQLLWYSLNSVKFQNSREIW